MRTKRLQRQLKKVFGDEPVEDRLASLLASSDLGAAKEVLENFPQFLDSIEEAYQQFEERATLTQRSMELSAAELTESNSRLFRMNLTFDAMLNSLGQGFLLFGPDGVSLDIYSKACEDLLETNPAGKHVAEVLGVPSRKREAFDGWIKILFEDKLDFTEFAKLGPNSFGHTKGKKISLEYRPVRGSSGQIDFVVVIATDFTKEFEASEAAKEMRAHLLLVTSIIRDKDRFIEFVAQSRKLIDKCESLLADGSNIANSFTEIKRHIHTLKGASGSFGMLPVQTRLHELETEISKHETAAGAAEFLGPEIPKLRALFEGALDDNAHIIGNLSGTEEPQRRVPLSKLVELEKILSAGAADQKAIALARDLLAVPCTEIFSGYESLVRDTANRLGKKVRWTTTGGADVRLVPENYGDLFQTFDHLFRNMMDHGIEVADERVAAGKSKEGTISVGVSRLRDKVEIRISDDGRGINVEKVRRKLNDLGMNELAAKGKREEILDAIFLPGLSTAETVTHTSGRGVGMDAVRASVTQYGGTITVESIAGKGTTFVIRLPVLSLRNSDSSSQDGARARVVKGKIA